MTTLNHLTTLVTAFASWTDLETALKAGYVPTLRETKSEPASWNKAVRALAYQLRAKGYRTK